ncbi:DICT sensory domain-containing protein [Conexibacter sp. JD483]|uniref:DICT sensory domain-containing protein n=1 Tax=unclassified Conexibacter TaxID=2627773 RepID=UPI00272622F1|nr:MULTISPECIES: DICT sensory domain-containing protein [unclassified Conexibacter]MDO8187123.1 DICT sensory domain-containing protein [Conexibacter sp. CPCC 205706]MDO8200299.1 DICT sensory domain-containing protein [Conexibacter sp. CPCC 205762]MDR9368905.1 DICT sensory domain-containing protein [Conexibacter sp. JD483]
MAKLSIGEVAARTGVGEGTLRMWEQRYGFPEPERTAAGARRYSDRDVEMIRQISLDRDRGLAMRAAIARARQPSGRDVSVFAATRRAVPGLVPQRLRKWALIAMSRAIEDESLAAAEQPVVLATFQKERFYRHVERRWEELARTARLAVVLADFPAPDMPLWKPIEVPIAPDVPLVREWALVVDAPGFAACLTAWEVPDQAEVPDAERLFEAIWTVEPEPVREAARVLLRTAVANGPELLGNAERLLDDVPPAGADAVAQLNQLTNRMVAYLARAAVPAPPRASV